MIPDDWRPVPREDGELAGYLVDAPGGLAVPTSLLGTSLGPAQDLASAAAAVAALGLASLDGRWWCRLPRPLPSGLLDAEAPAADWTWRPVVIVEVDASRCRVRPALPFPEESTSLAELSVPAAAFLREEQPAEQ